MKELPAAEFPFPIKLLSSIEEYEDKRMYCQYDCDIGYYRP